MKQITISHIVPVVIVSEQVTILDTFVKDLINDRSRTPSRIFKAVAGALQVVWLIVHTSKKQSR